MNKKEVIDILLTEYDAVHQHWMLATKQKAVIVQVIGGLLIALLGATFLDHIEKDLLFIILPLLFTVGAFVYAQKEADYWTAFICIESIEKAINLVGKGDLLVYSHRFKNILFDRKQILSFSPIRVLQIIRAFPIIGILIYCNYEIFQSYHLLTFIVIIFLQLLSVFYTFYTWQFVRDRATLRMDERLKSICQLAIDLSDGDGPAR